MMKKKAKLSLARPGKGGGSRSCYAEKKKSLTKKRFEEMKTTRARGGAEADEGAFECTKRGRFEWASWLVRMGR